MTKTKNRTAKSPRGNDKGRGIPCSYCRRRKRSCSGASSEKWPCQLCLTMNKVCAGPAALDLTSFGPAKVLKKLRIDFNNEPESPRDDSEQSAMVIVGPTPRERRSISTHAYEWRLASNQLSFALQHHLVQVHLSDLPGTSQRGMREMDPIERKFGTVGRLADLPPVEELAVQSFVLRGSYYSTHSAVVGHTQSQSLFHGFKEPPNESFIETGLQRHDVQVAVTRRLLELLAEVPISDSSFTVSMERLYLVYVTSRLFIVYSTSRRYDYWSDRRDMYSSLLKKSLELLDHPGCGEKERQHALTYISELLRDELLACLMTGKVTTASPDTYRIVFPRASEPLAPLHHLSDEDIKLICGTDADSQQTYNKCQMTFLGPLIQNWDVILGMLSYHPLKERSQTIRKVMGILARIKAILAHYFEAVSQGRRELGEFHERESDFLHWAYIFDVGGFEILVGAHKLADLSERKGKERDLAIASTKEKMGEWLVQLAQHGDIVRVLHLKHQRMEMIMARRIAHCVRLVRGRFLEEWVVENTTEAQILLEMVTYAAFTSATEARLAQELQAVLNGKVLSSPDSSSSPESSPGQSSPLYLSSVTESERHMEGIVEDDSEAQLIVEEALLSLGTELDSKLEISSTK